MSKAFRTGDICLSSDGLRCLCQCCLKISGHCHIIAVGKMSISVKMKQIDDTARSEQHTDGFCWTAVVLLWYIPGTCWDSGDTERCFNRVVITTAIEMYRTKHHWYPFLENIYYETYLSTDRVSANCLVNHRQVYILFTYSESVSQSIFIGLSLPRYQCHLNKIIRGSFNLGRILKKT